jgi:hypothetical protein
MNAIEAATVCAVKQHSVADVLGGFTLAILAQKLVFSASGEMPSIEQAKSTLRESP